MKGEAPHEFVDYCALLDSFDWKQKVAAIGAGNYRLLEKGLVKWTDIVTPTRVRGFREVVSNENLKAKQLTDAGIKP